MYEFFATHMYTIYMSGAYGGQKKVWDVLELELHMVVGAGE